MHSLFQRDRDLVKTVFETNTANIVCGWVRSIEEDDHFIMNDGSTSKELKVIYTESSKERYKTVLSTITPGTAVRVTGKLDEDNTLLLYRIWIMGSVAFPSKYPIAKHRPQVKHLRKYPHFRCRAAQLGSIMRIRSAATLATHLFFNEKSIVHIDTPLIVGDRIENNQFSIHTHEKGLPNLKDYFESEVGLRTTSKLHLESIAQGLGDCYTMGPIWVTGGGVSERWIIEVILTFSTIDDAMDLVEDYIRYVVKYVLKNCLEDLELLDKQLTNKLLHLLNHEFSKMSYEKCMEFLIVSKRKFETIPEGGNPFTLEHKNYITKQNGATIVYNHPLSLAPFDTKSNSDDTAASMEVLVPHLGSLAQGVGKCDFSPPEDAYIPEWYSDIKKSGSAPHSNITLKFDHLIMLLTKTSSLYDVIPFPRAHKNIIC